MKLNLISTLKNLSENSSIIEESIAKREKNKITYKINDDSYILKIVSPKKIVLNRNSQNLECTMNFEMNKTTSVIYTLKKEEYTIEIEIKTIFLNITENTIEIKYLVKDSNMDYQYKIEMSEYNEH